MVTSSPVGHQQQERVQNPVDPVDNEAHRRAVHADAERARRARQRADAGDALISRCGRCGSWQFDGRCNTGHQDDPAGRPPASTTSAPGGTPR